MYVVDELLVVKGWLNQLAILRYNGSTPELFAIYIQMMQTSKANESVSECSKIGLCITVKVLRML